MDQPERWKNGSGKIFQGCFISTFTLVPCVNFKKCHGKCRFLFSPLPNRKNSPLVGNRFGYLNRMEKKKTRKHPWTNEKILNSSGSGWWNTAGASILTRHVMRVGNIFREKTRACALEEEGNRIQSIPIFLTDHRRFRRKKLVSFSSFFTKI